MKLLIAQLNPIVADLAGNTKKILSTIAFGRENGADCILFSELVLCGYPPQDILQLGGFLDACTDKMEQIRLATKDLAVIVGFPRKSPKGKEKGIYNSACVLFDQNIIGYYDKHLLPTYDVFSERRYFEPGERFPLFSLFGKKVALTICEDLWQHSALLQDVNYKLDPIEEIRTQQPDLVLNLSASPYSEKRGVERRAVVQKAAKTLSCPVALCNQVGGNDSLIFDGRSLVIDGNGEMLGEGKLFAEDLLLVDLNEHKTVPILSRDPMEELFQALVLGLKDYCKKSGFKTALLGLSGGIDSAIVACIAKEALGKENLYCLSLPSRFSSQGSKDDARELAEHLGCSLTEVPIEEPFSAYLTLLSSVFKEDVKALAEENLQARIRGMLLMAFSNQFGHLVLATGNKSEMALGYSTLYGDLCGALAVIGDVAKTKIYQLAHWINRNGVVIPLSTLKKAPSAELRPNQKDSDTLPDYAIIDHILSDYVESHLSPKEIAKNRGYLLEIVEEIAQRIHKNEFKRRQSPPVLRVTAKAFSAGRLFPIVEKLTF